MQAPKFWYPKTASDKSIWSYLLWPLAQIIYFFSKYRFINKPAYKGKTPIICIGNVTVGGTGKTPTAIMIAQQAMEIGLKPVFLTKGYGGIIQGPYLVKKNDKVFDTGDEALILSSHAPTFISKDRVKGAQHIDQLKQFDLIITDDGLQNHPSLYAHKAILTVDASRLFGNGCLMPAGPLREPVMQAINKANVIMVIGASHKPLPYEITEAGKPVIFAHKKPLPHGADLSGEDVIVFSGLGNNKQFMDMVAQSGANIIHVEQFPDHYQYSERIIQRLIDQARNSASLLVTTEKDMVKIPSRFYPFIVPFMITLDIAEQDQDFIQEFIQN